MFPYLARTVLWAKAISLLNHPNIVKVYDVSVNDDLQYIVMEYVDGMTLREYLNQRGGRLTNRETVHFICAATSGSSASRCRPTRRCGCTT